MKVLVIGGAGHVGSMIRPALEKQHHCTHYDLKPVPGAEANTVVGDINDESLLQRTLAEGRYDAVLHLAMGVDSRHHAGDARMAFAVNVCGTYQVLRFALAAGVQRVVYASSLSVYEWKWRESRPKPLAEDLPPNTWSPYGFSKRVAEFILQAASQRYPDRVITALRLIMPRQGPQWEDYLKRDPNHEQGWLGPRDTTAVFLAALANTKAGCHIIHATGDVHEKTWAMRKAHDVLGWSPSGE